jgi:dipeptidyl aminopeptidase/acylaminoacyl peptidase
MVVMARNTILISLGSVFLLMLACAPALPSAVPAASLAFFVFRLDPPALVQLSSDYKPIREIPISIPAECALSNLYSSLHDPSIAIELNCSFGQAVVWVNTRTGELKQAYLDSDSHFLAWTGDGKAVYLKVDSLGNTHIIRTSPDGTQVWIPITSKTYDLVPHPINSNFLFSFSRGMGLGSEMWLAKQDGNEVGQVFADAANYISFARWSPDGGQIAFIKIPDNPIPFTVGELWIMNADGSNAQMLTKADAGHGFAPAWSPDGMHVAYVVRENPEDARADQSASALLSNIYVVDVVSRTASKLTLFENARVDAPVWSPDGNNIAFSVFINDKMNVYLANPVSGDTQLVVKESACCPAWTQK